MTGQASTHATLLARLASGGDSGAWGEFCARYGELIHGVARRRGLQPADCDDVLQEVLLKLTKSMPGFRYDPTKGLFRSYLKTVVLHAIFTKSAQKRGEKPVEDVEALTRASGADPCIEELWETEWRKHHMRLAMQTIAVEFNEKDRLAFQSYAVDGHGAKATAALLGLSVDQVYQAKSLILKRVSRIIECQIREEG